MKQLECPQVNKCFGNEKGSHGNPLNHCSVSIKTINGPSPTNHPTPPSHSPLYSSAFIHLHPPWCNLHPPINTPTLPSPPNNTSSTSPSHTLELTTFVHNFFCTCRTKYSVLDLMEMNKIHSICHFSLLTARVR